ncbi:MAG: 2Fe-2S iron-sulfur cluster binding domain-containing protein [Bdellovibrionales bacterium]|nr:2Fe-2S iron-sulfur cluster binding domain-containing protein [Bdellovibrionales bacterium]
MGNDKPFRPARSYKITFVSPGGMSQSITVSPETMPSSGTGEPGSILDIALASGVEIDHACGGVCACSTCHVKIRSGLKSCNEPSEAEEDQLEKAPGITSQSRLACQCVGDASEDLVVEIPGWNRNRVREGL